MTDPDRRIVEFDRLNWLGKAVYVGGQVARSLGQLIDAAVERTADILSDAERAFLEGLGDHAEEAKILDEEPGRPEDTARS